MIHEFAGGESQVGLNCPKPASNLLNGRVFSLAGLSHTSSVDALTELSFGALWQENAMFTKLRWICVLRGVFEQAANGFREGLRVDELTDFGGNLFQRV